MPTTPTDGSKNAAQKLISIDEIFTPFRDMSMDRIARIIDEETHAGELLSRLIELVRVTEDRTEPQVEGLRESYREAFYDARAAIASATGQG